MLLSFFLAVEDLCLFLQKSLHFRLRTFLLPPLDLIGLPPLIASCMIDLNTLMSAKTFVQLCVCTLNSGPK